MQQKLYIFILLISFITSAQTTFVPDDNFEAYLEANGAGNGIANDNLASTAGMQGLPFLNIQNLNIADLTGIEVMTNLFTVFASGNTFTTLDVSGNLNLNTIIANNNPNLTTFTTIPGNNIRTLNLGNCAITQFDASFLLNVETLDLRNNMIASLDLTMNGLLDNLYVQNNALTFLDVANGDNGNILDFNATGNSGLVCINVDNASAGFLAIWQKDATTNFDENCYDTFVPDDNFENYLETHDDTGNTVPIGSNRSLGNGIPNDNYVRTSRISGVTSLNISSSMIADITGIEDFTALEVLDFSMNGVGNFDLSNNIALKELYCASNGMSNINVAANVNLEILDCSDNSNLTIDVSTNVNLKQLNAANNGTTSLNLGTISALETLNLANNNLTTLNLNNLSNLTDLHCNNNLVFAVSDYSPLTSLVNLSVDQTNLSSINLASNTLLETLSINLMSATGFSLDLSNNIALTSLSANTSDLSSLNVQNGNNGNITFFDVRFNDLTCIQVDDPTASYLSTWLKDASTSFESDCGTTSIPDVNFEYHLENHDANGNVVPVGSPNSMGNGIVDDGLVLTTRITGVTFLDISGNSINQLDGLETFAALEVLICSENNFNDFDFSQLPLLRELTMSNLTFPVLDLSSNVNIEKLIYHNANSTSLHLGSNTVITELDMGNNNISPFDFSPYTSLQILDLSDNFNLFNATFGTLTNLRELNVNGVGINSLDVSNNLLLETLALNNASGFFLDLSANTALVSLTARNADLSGINMQNGNNANIIFFDAEQNGSTMNCIQVDDPTATYLNTWNVDSNVVFTLDCSLTSIPDNIFENYLETHDSNGDSVVLGDPTSMGNGIANDGAVFTYRINTVTSLDISNQGIGEVIGIQDFTALEVLNCSGNFFNDLIISNLTNLRELYCHSVFLPVLNVTANTNLEKLIMYDANCSNLTLEQNTALNELNVRNNSLSVINTVNLTAMEVLNYENNAIDSLGYSNMTNLKTLNANNNSVRLMDLSNNTLLETLLVDTASGFNLDLSNNSALTYLSANNSDLSGLNMQNGNNANVTFFDARSNVFNCIQVDDPTAGYLVMWQKDPTTFFSLDCRQTYVPGDNFENYLETHDASGNTVTVGDPTSMGNGIANDNFVLTAAIETVTSINLFGENINDITGIEDFTALTDFISYDNNFTTIDLSANTNLQTINLSLTPVSSLSIGSNTNLTNLNVFGTALASFDISQCPNIEILSCSFSPIGNLNLTANTKLRQLFADETPSLTTIDITGLTDLIELRLDNSGITSLDVTSNTALQTVRFENTSISTIDLSNNTALQSLFAANASLSTLDVTTNTMLQFLGVSNNALQILDLSQNTALTSIFIQNNNLSYLNLKNGANTSIISLNITNNPNLTCVLVDSDNYADTNFTNKDVQTVYNDESCGQTLACPADITVDKDAGLCEAAIEVTAPTVFGDAGTVGNALNFDGIDDRVTVSSGFTNDLSEVTIEVKVNLDVISNWDTLLNYTNWAPGYLHFQINPSGLLGWSVNGNSPTDQYVDVGLQTNTWYNIAVSYSATNNVARFYVNGVLQAERTYTTALPLVANRQFNIGAWNSNRFLDGTIDDFRIWNTVRSADEIQSSLDIPLSGNEAGLIAYFKFDQGQACADNSIITTLDDATGNYSATLHNFELSALSIDCSSNFRNGTIQDYLLVNDYNNTTVLTETFPVGTTNVTWTFTDAQNQTDQCMQIITVDDADGGCNEVAISPKVFLQGALLNPNTGEESWMRDDFRLAGLIPTTSPYDMSEANGIVFMTPSQNAIVDWLQLELRDATDNNTIIAETSALLQRDGDVVGLDGFSPVTFAVSHDNYYIVVKHKNHLSIMTAMPIALTNIPTSVDFTDATNQITFGSNAQTSFGMPANTVAMWCGNANGDTIIQYSGTSPDTPSILSAVLNDIGNFLNFPTYVVNGYENNDVNMDGNTQYSGTNPDTPFILQNVLAHPGNFLNFSTYQIVAQLPENQ